MAGTRAPTLLEGAGLAQRSATAHLSLTSRDGPGLLEYCTSLDDPLSTL